MTATQLRVRRPAAALTRASAASGVGTRWGEMAGEERVFIGDFTRKEFRERMEAGLIKAAIVPISSTEQHQVGSSPPTISIECDMPG